LSFIHEVDERAERLAMSLIMAIRIRAPDVPARCRRLRARRRQRGNQVSVLSTIQALGHTLPGLPQRHPRWVFHVTPTAASWPNAAEGFVSTPTRRRLRRGMLQAATDPEQPIARCIHEHNATPEAIPMDQARRYPPRQARPAATTFRMSRCRRQPVGNYRYKSEIIDITSRQSRFDTFALCRF
jgi:hypothetical protein